MSESAARRLFALDGASCLLDEQHLGIINGLLSTNVTYRDVLSCRGLFAPPFVSSDFRLETRLFGEKVRTQKYTWFPTEVRRTGVIHGVKVSSTTVLAVGRRALLLTAQLENRTGKPVHVPVQFNILGGLDINTRWEFSQPASSSATQVRVSGQRLVKRNDSGAIVLGTSMAASTWQGHCSHWEGELRLPAGATRELHLALAIGPETEAVRDVEAILRDPGDVVAAARRDLANRVRNLFDKLPTLHAKDARLTKFYNRSLVHFLLNRWDVPEFKLHPYYSTGSVMGGCVASYLWDFGNNWGFFPLYDPEALREHVKAFLSIDLTRHFAFLPLAGEAFGPWYYINQEKIIFLVYHYVLHTGDVAFLHERVDGTSATIIEHVIRQALVGDDLTKAATLTDYGDGNHHLELRREYRYDHVLPDMNGRRCACFLAAHTLCQLAGKSPAVDFPARAQALKRLLRRTLWSAKDRWFHWQDAKGRKELRYTIQMFKMIGGPALDRDQEQGLLSHLNEREFLSEYGIHSMSKLDPAFDQVDIDNGGGGCCSCFPGPIIHKLYRAGYPQLAEDVLRRILWWGERLPYWSDSLVANQMDYRKDTPLQNAIGSISAAQSLVFGMLGVHVEPDGKVRVAPNPSSFSPEIELTGLRLRGRQFDIRTTKSRFEVTVDGRKVSAKRGGQVRV
ncbi:MAG: hypothetical protein A3K19_04860 [Lentisphaerae bacterium RIFOXYB12_FULL_65_16]|nr:MAG: hypothetical protein A3K18_15550 [Lentisphaerae bacterium RIFOXYA12_64_32]OGV89721.1 MAG: hypothetical protein A3K19_04860 [Lentisphaerae bacterium RIFOXYB12_FULL_65_16]